MAEISPGTQLDADTLRELVAQGQLVSFTLPSGRTSAPGRDIARALRRYDAFAQPSTRKRAISVHLVPKTWRFASSMVAQRRGLEERIRALRSRMEQSETTLAAMPSRPPHSWTRQDMTEIAASTPSLLWFGMPGDYWPLPSLTPVERQELGLIFLPVLIQRNGGLCPTLPQAISLSLGRRTDIHHSVHYLSSHPHISSDRATCWGNATEVLQHAMEANNIGTVITLLAAARLGYNSGSEYSSTWWLRAWAYWAKTAKAGFSQPLENPYQGIWDGFTVQHYQSGQIGPLRTWLDLSGSDADLITLVGQQEKFLTAEALANSAFGKCWRCQGRSIITPAHSEVCVSRLRRGDGEMRGSCPMRWDGRRLLGTIKKDSVILTLTQRARHGLTHHSLVYEVPPSQEGRGCYSCGERRITMMVPQGEDGEPMFLCGKCVTLVAPTKEEKDHWTSYAEITEGRRPS